MFDRPMVPDMDLFKLDDLRTFCLCDLSYSKHSSHVSRFKWDSYTFPEEGAISPFIPKYVRVYFWKIMTAYTMVVDSSNETINKCIEDLRVSTSTSLTVQQRLVILEQANPIYKFMTKYTKDNFRNSTIYDKLTLDGWIKAEICESIGRAGGHSWVSYILPVTEKVWVNGEMSFDDFINRLPEELRDYKIWDYTMCHQPEIRDE